jgi:two-component system, OmpR family, phosphate regulon sensor histidine kinase PhoR
VIVEGAAADSRLIQVLVERSPNGILVTGRDGLLQVVNKAASEMLTMVGNPLGRRPEDAIMVPEVVQAFTVNSGDDIHFRYGSKEYLIRVVDLDIFGRLLILEDVTNIRRSEQYRREFVANVSHELRTPTTSIAGYAETLLSGHIDLSEDARFMVDVIHRNALRLNNLFEDLLTLSRIDNSDSPLPTKPLQLEGLISDCIDKQRPRADERNINFQVIIAPQSTAFCNRDALNHVIGNLVENAVKYSQNGGLVTVRVSPRVNEVLIEVIDLGEGIAPTHQERIFERFYRVDKARSREVGGTGLGLAIVKRLIDRMNARIELRSRVGSGSIFRVFLARAAEEI